MLLRVNASNPRHTLPACHCPQSVKLVAASMRDHLACHEWAVNCFTGEDVEVVGGADADNNFMTLSDTSSCGKLTALAKLLHLWYHEATANKV